MPGNPAGRVTPTQHNADTLGITLADSPYTAWSHDPRIALVHANKHGPGGVVLRVQKGLPEPGDPWRWVPSFDDTFWESEIFLQGERYGADVFNPW